MQIKPKFKYACPKSAKKRGSGSNRSGVARKKVAGIITPPPLHRTMVVNGYTGRATFI